MKKLLLTTVLVFFIFILSGPIFGQQPAVSPTPSDDVVKITTSLIQLDAVVTGKDGMPVRDLRKEDFQVFQDGKPQQMTSVVYVDSGVARNSVVIKKEKNQIDTPPAGIRNGQGRLVTFVLDDGNCLATIEGNFNMREAMKNFVDKQMQPDDRIAIYRTKGGSSLLQLYTSDKDVLRKKIDKLGLLATGGCGSAFDQSDPGNISSGGANRGRSPIQSDPKTEMYKRERDNQMLATITILNFVVERLKKSPQRKELFLLSEGLATDHFSRSRDALRDLADKAARASVVVHTFSNKGLSTPGVITAADGVSVGDVDRVTSQRIDEESALNGGLAYLAYTTGGKFVANRTFFERDIARILNTEDGYYLIGYEPDDETFKGKEFHKIEVKVTRPELNVTSRKGFFGRPDNDLKPLYKTADGELFDAVSSPFLENGIDLRLTILSGYTEKEGSFVRAMFHIKGEDLKLIDEADGKKKFVMDVVTVALDEKAKVVGEFNHTYTTQIPSEAIPTVMKNGLDFSSDMAVKTPGLYTYRVAIRDANSRRLGSAGNFIEIPDIKKGKFTISGLIATTFDNNGKAIVPENRPQGGFGVVQTKASAVLRQYSPGEILVYKYMIHNAKIQGNQPSLTRQIRLFRDGKMLLDSGEKPIVPNGNADLTRLEDLGNIRITDQVAPGEYSLQIVIRDKNAKEVSEQSIDFEVMGQ